ETDVAGNEEIHIGDVRLRSLRAPDRVVEAQLELLLVAHLAVNGLRASAPRAPRVRAGGRAGAAFAHARGRIIHASGASLTSDDPASPPRLRATVAIRWIESPLTRSGTVMRQCSSHDSPRTRTVVPRAAPRAAAMRSARTARRLRSPASGTRASACVSETS